jgi:hypothetical protein
MAALTRSGARKASEIVMLTFRTLQPSRPAMLSVFALGSAMSSSSQLGSDDRYWQIVLQKSENAG